MTKNFDALVFIGRFQPFHNGHESVIRRAIAEAKEVIVVVGSSFAARTPRNPFTFEERKSMIKAVFPENSVKVVPVADYPYDDNKWVAAVQTVVHSALSWSAGPTKIGLIGHAKDHTSYYLNIFPTWGNVDVLNFKDIHATDIRNAMLGDNAEGFDVQSAIPTQAHRVISKIISGDFGDFSEAWLTLIAEHRMIEKYKESWKVAPFPPTFVTVDAVVVQSGHVLLVKRGARPGKGLLALPGGFLNQDETLLSGALRELKEETKIKVPVPVLRGSIKSQNTFDNPNRSQRGRTITTAFFIDLGFDSKLPKVKGADDAVEANWFPFSQVRRENMFEDHFSILDYFVNIG
jgi:bifunctional NMN adenylyltransferase/nudix hydrolase